VNKDIDTSPKGTRLGDGASATFNVAYVCLDVKSLFSMCCRSRLKRFQ
jgi:hypothetical protein